MSIVAFGLNHHSTPLELLERAVVPVADAAKLARAVVGDGPVAGAVVLTTCNRIEIYVDAERFHDSFAVVRDALVAASGVDPADLGRCLQALWESEAVEHLFSVASGLDSAVLGEHEILGQVRGAWQAARTESTLTPSLDRLFQRAVEVGKRVRTETAVGRGTVSVGHAAVGLAIQRLDGLAGRRALVVGAGAMAQVTAAALARAGAHLVIANRTIARAEALAATLDGAEAVGLDALAHELGRADAVVVATTVAEPVVTVADLDSGAQRAVLVVDLGLPRNVDPAARALVRVDLADLEDIRSFSEAGLASRREAAGEASELVAEAAARFAGERLARGADPVVAGLRTWAEELRLAELARYRGRLAGLDEDQRAVVEDLTRTLLAKVLHEPTMALKDAAGTPRGTRLAGAAAELFPLSDQ